MKLNPPLMRLMRSGLRTFFFIIMYPFPTKINHSRGGEKNSQSGHEYRKNGKMALHRYARYSFLYGLTSS
jgi:hypothetical protein